MANITLKDILGTDNISLSRTIINKNMQTVANALNTIQGYLNTETPGGTLKVGSVTLKLGQNTINTVLSKNEASGEIDGNLRVKQDVVIDNNTKSKSLNVSDKVIINDTKFELGVGTGVDFKHTNGMHIAANMVTPEANYKVAHEHASGIVDVNVTGERKIVLDYALLPANATNETSNTIRLTGEPVLGQLLYITIGQMSNDYAGLSNPKIYIEGDNFHNKYGMTVQLFNAANQASINAAIGFTGENANEFKRQWVELIYNGSTWEVLNAHPGIEGI